MLKNCIQCVASHAVAKCTGVSSSSAACTMSNESLSEHVSHWPFHMSRTSILTPLVLKVPSTVLPLRQSPACVILSTEKLHNHDQESGSLMNWARSLLLFSLTYDSKQCSPPLWWRLHKDSKVYWRIVSEGAVWTTQQLETVLSGQKLASSWKTTIFLKKDAI